MGFVVCIIDIAPKCKVKGFCRELFMFASQDAVTDNRG